ncbi:PIN domain-containing protein [Rugamonas sp. DEMB1]|uniref:PIN domain-containing protein n=1 Tax=Rugamonas sp. DEMB1 TaxID=3039386 RepID=UPI00244C71F6|nr:PIN domain-containing protein [Rugamonas sp. DEMB1]WGG51283.1 PIN domain-containing protein [Rugamonas sp. DEMB1]
MALALFDSNILIDALKGYEVARRELMHYDDGAISAITWIEVVSGTHPAARPEVMTFLADFELQVIQTNETIMLEAANLRGASLFTPPKIALPDAIIIATGNVTGRLIITRNWKDFRGTNIRIPYELQTDNGATTAVNVLPFPD